MVARRPAERHQLCRQGLPAHALTLEITESAAIDDNAMAEHVLLALHQLGVAIAVDDFGTGHSSLVESRQPIVATAVQLAHSLGLRVVAEGVEDFPTLEALQTLGCDLAQGYHFSRPLPAAEFAAWLGPPTLV